MQCDLVQGAAWIISACGVGGSARVQRDQYKVCCGSVEGCDVAQLRMGCGSVRVQCGSVKGAAWLSRVPWGSVRVRRGSVQGGAASSVQGAVWLC